MRSSSTTPPGLLERRGAPLRGAGLSRAPPWVILSRHGREEERRGAVLVIAALLAVLAPPPAAAAAERATRRGEPARTSAGAAANSIEGALTAVNLALSAWDRRRPARAPRAARRRPGRGRGSPRPRGGQGGRFHGDLSGLLCPEAAPLSDGETTTYTAARTASDRGGRSGGRGARVSEGVVSFRSSRLRSPPSSAASRGGRAASRTRGSSRSRARTHGGGKAGAAATSAGAPRRPARQRSWSTGRSREGGTTARRSAEIDETAPSRGSRRARASPTRPGDLPAAPDRDRGDRRVCSRGRLRPRRSLRESAVREAVGLVLQEGRGDAALRRRQITIEGSCASAITVSTERSSSSRLEPGDEPSQAPRGRSPGGGRRPGGEGPLHRRRRGRDRRGADGSVDRSYPDCHQVGELPRVGISIIFESAEVSLHPAPLEALRPLVACLAPSRDPVPKPESL